ncbi:MAG: PaaI family thioesterase [Chloroflexi bacterium]|nr:MAG: PaaI family thioesterase [Chloroflexota bacterium]
MSQGTTIDMLNIKIVSAEQDRIVGTMPIGPHQRQVSGYLHGGVSVVLAETLASLGSMLSIDTDTQLAFGLEINANHLRSKREGIVTGVATAIHKGRTTHIWDIKISDEQDKLICVSRCTVAVVQKPVDNEQVHHESP